MLVILLSVAGGVNLMTLRCHRGVTQTPGSAVEQPSHQPFVTFAVHQYTLQCTTSAHQPIVTPTPLL